MLFTLQMWSTASCWVCGSLPCRLCCSESPRFASHLHVGCACAPPSPYPMSLLILPVVPVDGRSLLLQKLGESEVLCALQCLTLLLWLTVFPLFPPPPPFKWKKTQKKARGRGGSPCPHPVISLPTLWRDK